MSSQHICPGGCGKQVPYHLLACGPCWRALPDDIRKRVNVAYGRRQVDPRGHRDAVAEATAWFRGTAPSAALHRVSRASSPNPSRSSRTALVPSTQPGTP